MYKQMAEDCLEQFATVKAFVFFICTLYIFPFKACQKGHEAEHCSSEKISGDCYYLIVSYFYQKNYTSFSCSCPFPCAVLTFVYR